MESAENQDRSPKTDRLQGESQDLTSLSKIETIKLLNDSIDRLESTIKDISQNSVKKLPSSESIENLLNTTRELADSVTPAPVTAKETTVEEIPATSATQTTSAIPTTESTLIETNPIPAAEIKSKPTENVPSKKTVVKKPNQANRGLIIFGAIAIAIILTLAWLGYPQIKAAVFPASETTEVVAIKENEPEIQPLPEKTNVPLDPNTAINTETDNLVTDTPATETESETSTLIIPQDLASPGKAKNLKIETIEPELTFTPEQTFIAALQAKLVEVADDYDSDLLNNVRVDLLETSLLVEVTDNWYELSESRQAKLANDILKRSRQLDFKKLQLQDSAGTLVARNPVVGDRMIILQSSKNS